MKREAAFELNRPKLVRLSLGRTHLQIGLHGKAESVAQSGVETLFEAEMGINADGAEQGQDFRSSTSAAGHTGGPSLTAHSSTPNSTGHETG